MMMMMICIFSDKPIQLTTEINRNIIDTIFSGEICQRVEGRCW